jgi:hypothetical protein
VAGSIGEMNYAGMQWVLREPPSFYARRNCYYGASFPSLAELDGRDEVGIEQICWGNDYPHYEGTFPYNLESLQLTFPGVPDRERRMILGENAARLYKFDLERLRPLAARYGPTPAQVDTPLQEVPADSGCYLFVDERRARAAAAL